MNCVCCGQKVITDKHHPYMKYCSSKCSAKGQEARQRELLTDRIVKRHLYITSKGKLKYNQITQDMIVEKRAGLLERRKRIAELKQKKKSGKTCKICGKEFKNKSATPFCGDECRKINNEKHYEKQLARMRAKYKNTWVARSPFICRECGKTVTIEFGNKRESYCSEECMSKSVKRNLLAKRRMRIAGGYIEHVSVTYIYNRDRETCHICRRHININLKHPHPMSMTLDHVIPIAKGGTHERKNIKAAHLICNSTKRDLASEHGDQLLLFG